jgi:hydroxyacylglutathione hydrolase
MKLTQNLYAYVWKGNDNNCNSYIYANVLRGNKHIIIDPGHIVTPYLGELAYERLAKEIVQDGLKLEDIGLVALTHAHPDHVEAAKIFKDKYQAKIAINQDDAMILRRFGGDKVDCFVEEGVMQCDNLIQDKLEIYKVPGHSPGHIAIYWPAQKALAVGDVIFFHNTGRVDLPGGDAAEMQKSIQKLSRLDAEYVLCGHPYGHPGVIQGKKAVQENFAFLLDNLPF